MCKSHYDDLLIRISNRDKTALEELYISLKSSVFSIGLAILKDEYAASDVMQDTFVRVWNKAYQYHPSTDAKAWIIKIARNLALKQLKRQKKEINYEVIEDLTDGYNQDSIDKIVISELLGTLNSTERQIVVLYSVCGYSHKDIARIINVPYATVRWAYSNAKKKLDKKFSLEGLYGKHE